MNSSNKRKKLAILDGNNICYYQSKGGKPKLANLLVAMRFLEEQGYSLLVIVSSALKYSIDKPNRLIRLINQGKIIEAPSFTNDDLLILKNAKERPDSVVISNDNFSEYEEPKRQFGFVLNKNSTIKFFKKS